MEITRLPSASPSDTSRSVGNGVQVTATVVSIHVRQGFEASVRSLEPEPHVITRHRCVPPPLDILQSLLEPQMLDGVKAVVDRDVDTDAQRRVQLVRLTQEASGHAGRSLLRERRLGFAQTR